MCVEDISLGLRFLQDNVIVCLDCIILNVCRLINVTAIRRFIEQDRLGIHSECCVPYCSPVERTFIFTEKSKCLCAYRQFLTSSVRWLRHVYESQRKHI